MARLVGLLLLSKKAAGSNPNLGPVWVIFMFSWCMSGFSLFKFKSTLIGSLVMEVTFKIQGEGLLPKN